MCEHRTIAAFAIRKGAEKFGDPMTEKNRQRQNRSELNHDRIHFPKAAVQIEAKQCLDNSQVRR